MHLDVLFFEGAGGASPFLMFSYAGELKKASCLSRGISVGYSEPILPAGQGGPRRAGWYHFLKGGVLSDVQAIFTVHVNTVLPVGLAGSRPGTVLTGAAWFTGTIAGKLGARWGHSTWLTRSSWWPPPSSALVACETDPLQGAVHLCCLCKTAMQCINAACNSCRAASACRLCQWPSPKETNLSLSFQSRFVSEVYPCNQPGPQWNIVVFSIVESRLVFLLCFWFGPFCLDRHTLQACNQHRGSLLTWWDSVWVCCSFRSHLANFIIGLAFLLLSYPDFLNQFYYSPCTFSRSLCNF